VGIRARLRLVGGAIMSTCIEKYPSQLANSVSGGSSPRVACVADPTMTAYAKLRSLSTGLTVHDADADSPTGRKAGVTVNGKLKNGRHIYNDAPPIYPTLERAIMEALKVAEATQ